MKGHVMLVMKPLAAEIHRRISSVLDGTSLTENEEVITALTQSVLFAVGADGPATIPPADLTDSDQTIPGAK